MKDIMTVKFWGVRGSIPSPGLSTVRYGGNTSCVSIRLGTEKILVMDAGTGIRLLGKVLAGETADIFVLVTHIHWDHIQGFPFFDPIYQKDREIFVFPYLKGQTMFYSLIQQMDGAHFPVSMDSLPARCNIINEDIGAFMRKKGFNISRIATNHPGGAYGYRIENEGRSVVYLTDNELDPPFEKTHGFDDYARFCKDADILIHDAQYIERDMPSKHGFGHSVVRQACDLAVAARVKHLILYHHDPDRSDDELDLIQIEANSYFKKNNHSIICSAAYEGMEISI